MVVNCKELSESIKKDIKKRIDNLKNRNINVCLAVILVGDDPASKIYVRNKKRACEQLGIISKEYALRRLCFGVDPFLSDIYYHLRALEDNTHVIICSRNHL